MDKNKEKGSVIVFSILLLTVILSITLALTNIFIPKLRAISEATNSISALYAADSAMEWCLYSNRGKLPAVSEPTMSNGATYLIYRDGTPSTCTAGESVNYRTVGTYRGVSRSFEVGQI